MSDDRATIPCRGPRCGAPIFYVSSPNGRPMPVDAKEVTIAVLDPETPRAPVKLVKGHVPHHITCPDAAAFRKEGR